MPRGIDPLMLAEFRKPLMRPRYLVTLGLRKPLHIWTGVHPLTWNGLTFKPQAGNMEVGDTETALDGTQEKLKLKLSGVMPEDIEPPPSAVGEVVENHGYTGRRIVVTSPGPEFRTLRAVCIGGQGGWDNYNDGGPGGYSVAVIAVSFGEKFSLIVGNNGLQGGGAGGTIVSGFGGANGAVRSGGGGLSGLFYGDAPISAFSASRAVCIAGGGGAGGRRGTAQGVGEPGQPGNASGSGGMPSMQGVAASGGNATGQGGGGGGHTGGRANGRPGGVGGSGYVSPRAIKTGIVRVLQPGDNAGLSYPAGMSTGNVRLYWGDESVRTPVISSVYLAAVDENEILVGEPYPIFRGTLEPSEFNWGVGDNAVEAILELRRAEAAYEKNTGRRYTHEDQQARFPGDLGLEYYKAVANLSLTFTAIQ